MKIVDIADFFSERGGGVRSYLGELASEGARHGHEVVVVAPGPRDVEEPFMGGRLVRFAGPSMPYDPTYHLLWRVDRILDVIRRERPQVLQASSPYLPALVARSVQGSLRSFVYHSDQIATYVRPLLERVGHDRLKRAVLRGVNAWPRRLSRGFDFTIAPSETIADNLRAAGCERVRCVRFGIRSDIFSPQRANPKTRDRLLGPLALVPNAAVAVVACRLAVEKRVDQIIEAVRIVNRHRPMALIVLGDGPERSRLEARARTLPHAVFPGFLPRPEYADILASADVFVHGGAAETFGFVLGEAMLSGVPIVIPDAGAALDVVRSGVAETYSAYAGPSAIAASICRTLDAPRGSRPPSATIDVRTTAEHFEELFAIYEEELSRRRAA